MRCVRVHVMREGEPKGSLSFFVRIGIKLRGPPGGSISQEKLFHDGDFRVLAIFRTGENTPFHETCRSLFAFYGWQMALSIICERLIVCLYIGAKKNAY